MKGGMNICGLNTAAMLWCSAAMGAGAGLVAQAMLLRPLVNAINRALHPRAQRAKAWWMHCKKPIIPCMPWTCATAPTG
jgi:uncharacterized membrane protein YhiD involved in acid resistance